MVSKNETATITTVARDIREVKGLVQGQAKVIRDQGVAIQNLEDWKRGLDIAKQAVDEYKKQEENDRYQKAKTTVYINKAEVLKYLVPLIIAIMALVYAYTSRIKP